MSLKTTTCNTKTHEECTLLATLNAHERDARITFTEWDHKYVVNAKEETPYLSVTTFGHSLFPIFDADKVIDTMTQATRKKYKGMTHEEIKALWNSGTEAQLGTLLHSRIEHCYNQSGLPVGYRHRDLIQLGLLEDFGLGSSEEEDPAWDGFVQFVRDTPDLQPYRTEQRLFHEEAQLAGSVDLMVRNDDGTYSLFDWKRSKAIEQINTYGKYATHCRICHFPDLKYWHYSIQLNLYKYILQTKYGVTIRDLTLVRFHPNLSGSSCPYERIEAADCYREVSLILQDRIEALQQKRKDALP